MEYRIIKRNKKSVGVISYKDASSEYGQKWITAGKYETDKQLERRMLDWMDDYESNNMSEPAKVKFGNYLDSWLKNRDKLSQTTIDGYSIYIEKHIKPALGELLLVKIKAMDLDKFYKKLSNSIYTREEKEIKYSPNTVIQAHAIIHKALKYAWKNKFIKDNPADFVENVPQRERKKFKTYTVEDFKNLMDAVEGTIDEIFIILAGCLGLRRGEVLGLKWNDIDFKQKIIHVRKTKVKTTKGILEKDPKNITSIRDIAVNSKAIQALKQWKLKCKFDSEYVCNKFNPNTYSGHFKLLLENKKLPHTRFHDLRHFAATFMLKSGISDKVAAQRLGHSQVSTTRDIYQHVLEEMDKEAAEKLNKLF